jgi:hypothetical protein
MSFQSRSKKIFAEKAPSKKELAGENRPRAVGNFLVRRPATRLRHWHSRLRSSRVCDAEARALHALDFPLSRCAEKLVRKHVASRRIIIK